MGAKQVVAQEKKGGLIQPVPGTFGARIRKKGHITVYSDKQIICLKVEPEMTCAEIRALIKQQTGSDMKLFIHDNEMRDSDTILELGIDERTMIRAIGTRTADSESRRCSISNLNLSTSSTQSVRSAPVKNNSRFSSPETSHSLPAPMRKNPLEIDLSVYAVPEAGTLLRGKKRRRRIISLLPIEEIDRIFEEDRKHAM